MQQKNVTQFANAMIFAILVDENGSAHIAAKELVKSKYGKIGSSDR